MTNKEDKEDENHRTISAVGSKVIYTLGFRNIKFPSEPYWGGDMTENWNIFIRNSASTLHGGKQEHEWI